LTLRELRDASHDQHPVVVGEFQPSIPDSAGFSAVVAFDQSANGSAEFNPDRDDSSLQETSFRLSEFEGIHRVGTEPRAFSLAYHPFSARKGII
jgi:hypothetical protein